MRCCLRSEFVAVRAGSITAAAIAVSRDSGPRGRRIAAIGAIHSGGHVSAGKTWTSLCSLWIGRRHRTDRRPDSGRVDHGQLRLAVDFFHQHPNRHLVAFSDASAGRGHAQNQEGGRRCQTRRVPSRHDWFRSYRPYVRFPRSSARQGTGRRLVRIQLHRRVYDACCDWPDCPNRMGVASGAREEPPCPGLEIIRFAEFS